MKNNISIAERLKKTDKNIILLLLLTVGMFVVMSVANPELFLSVSNFQAMGLQIAELGFFSAAMMISFMSGGIDLSIVGTANLTGVLAGYMFVAVERNGWSDYTGWFILLAFLLAIVIGTAAGAVNGFLIATFHINPMLVTMGTLDLYMGIAIVITKAGTIVGFPEAVSDFGNAAAGVLSVPLVMLIILFVVTGLMMNRTKFGFELRFFGTNPLSTQFSGIKNSTVLLKTYIYCGIVSAIAGLMMIMKANSARSEFGTSYSFTAMLCVILGGVSPNGGKGTIGGLILALLSLQFLSSGFNMLGVNSIIKDFIWGVLLLAVMLLNFFFEQRNNRAKLKKSE